MVKCIICEDMTENMVGSGKNSVYACRRCVAQVVVEEKATSMMSLTKRQMILEIWSERVGQARAESHLRVVNPNLASVAHSL